MFFSTLIQHCTTIIRTLISLIGRETRKWKKRLGIWINMTSMPNFMSIDLKIKLPSPFPIFSPPPKLTHFWITETNEEVGVWCRKWMVFEIRSLTSFATIMMCSWPIDSIIMQHIKQSNFAIKVFKWKQIGLA